METKLKTGGGARLRGIDVSHYQGDVDWDEVAGAGVAFAYVKATEGMTGRDPAYARHRRGARAENLRVGAYHFFRPDDDPQKQADHFLSVVEVRAGDLPPALDLERADAEEAGEAFRDAALAWLKRVETATGCAPVVYASPVFWNSHLGADFASYRYWLAEYASKPNPPKTAPPWTFWQHSQRGQVPGVHGMVDLNWSAAGDLSAMLCGGTPS
ncbi:MAG: GH25 family lysozyme [Pseudomonadota bacterium]